MTAGPGKTRFDTVSVPQTPLHKYLKRYSLCFYMKSKRILFTHMHAFKTDSCLIFLDFAIRIWKYAQVRDEVLIQAVIYLDRADRGYGVSCDIKITWFSVHRLIATAVMIAQKYHDDLFFSNKEYATIFGIKLKGTLQHHSACHLVISRTL